MVALVGHVHGSRRVHSHAGGTVEASSRARAVGAGSTGEGAWFTCAPAHRLPEQAGHLLLQGTQAGRLLVEAGGLSGTLLAQGGVLGLQGS